MKKSKTTNNREKAHEIAAIMCERYFKTVGDESGIKHEKLPLKFWNDVRFAKHYRLQLIKVNALLKTYSGEAILAALKSFKGSKIYSIQAKWLDPLIAAEEAKIKELNRQIEENIQKKIEKQRETIEEEIDIQLEPKIGQIPTPKQSLFDKLN